MFVELGRRSGGEFEAVEIVGERLVAAVVVLQPLLRVVVVVALLASRLLAELAWVLIWVFWSLT